MKMKKVSCTAAFLFLLTLKSLVFIFFFVRHIHTASLPKGTLRRAQRYKAGISSSRGAPKLSLRRKLEKQFRHLNSTLVAVTSADERVLRKASCVLIATSQPNYRYTKRWIQRQRKRRIAFIHFTTGKLKYGSKNGKKLPPHYGRIFALLAARAVLPKVRTFVYTDIDTAINFKRACKLNTHPMTVSWKPQTYTGGMGMGMGIGKGKKILRTAWLVYNPKVSGSSNDKKRFAPARLLQAWLKHARNVHLQDQTVLNELYRGKAWVRDYIRLFTPKKSAAKIDRGHCGSYMDQKKRDTCIKRIHRV